MSLTPLALAPVIRAAVELADAVNRYRPEDHAAALAGPDREPGADITPHRGAWHDALDRIGDAAERLKRSLGATGGLQPSGHLPGYDPDPPDWRLYKQQFRSADHPPAVRQGLHRLALAAIDLSGYAADDAPPAEWRERGMSLTGDGVRQLLTGLSAAERRAVGRAVRLLGRALGWPGGRPPAGRGSEDDGFAREHRCIDATAGFFTRDMRSHLRAVHLGLESQAALARMRAAERPSAGSPAETTDNPAGASARRAARNGERGPGGTATARKRRGRPLATVRTPNEVAADMKLYEDWEASGLSRPEFARALNRPEDEVIAQIERGRYHVRRRREQSSAGPCDNSGVERA